MQGWRFTVFSVFDFVFFLEFNFLCSTTDLHIAWALVRSSSGALCEAPTRPLTALGATFRILCPCRLKATDVVRAAAERSFSGGPTSCSQGRRSC